MTRPRARVGPLTSRNVTAPALDVDALIDDPGTRIVVCCGAGGVGKTTTSAAIALRAAERGRKVVVLTIDPARRLAQSMGIEELDNTPRPVPGVVSADGGSGSLDAMMLDMKRTFDEVVENSATPEKAKQILENPFYIAVSSSFAGTQEYMAMEKLGQLDKDARKTGRWDLIVVDTPPSRSALDFLDSPDRLSSFLDGRFMRLLLVPARGPARLMTMGFGLVTSTLAKVIGAQVLTDLQTFVTACDTLFGGFRARAQRTFDLLQADGTSFLVVAAPEPDAMREAAYFVERLSAEDMPLAGLVVNRASVAPTGELSADRAMAGVERLRDLGGGRPGHQHDGRAAAPARRPAAHRRARGPPARAVRHQPPRRRHGGAAGTVHRRARPRRPAPHRQAAGRAGQRQLSRRFREGTPSLLHHRTDPGGGGGAPAPSRDPRLVPRGAQAWTASAWERPACSDIAVSSRVRQDVTLGRLRRTARRSRSVMPPQTPHSISLSSASARHSVRTGQPAHTSFARCCSAPRTKSSSGDACLHTAAEAQSSFHIRVFPSLAFPTMKCWRISRLR